MSADLHPVELTESELDHAHDFWDDIILNRDGTVSMSHVYAELIDYEKLMMNVSRVYNHITCGKMSYVAYLAADVIRESDACVDNMIATEVNDVLQRIQDGEDVEDLIKEYSVKPKQNDLS